MLIPLQDLATQHGIVPHSVIHAGAHLAEEAPAYRAAGVTNVLWIEGNPDLIDRLEGILAPYGQKVVQALLGAEPGREVTFHVSNFDSMSSSVLEFGTHTSASPEVLFVGAQTHRLQALDEVARQAGFLGADFLNLDLQGYELECLKGGERVVAKLNTIYTEVNVDELYSGCVLLPELDLWLNERGFEAAAVKLYGCSRRDCADGQHKFFGWGDCCYVRVPVPRRFQDVYPEEAADWFSAPNRAAAGPVVDLGTLTGRLGRQVRRLLHPSGQHG